MLFRSKANVIETAQNVIAATNYGLTGHVSAGSMRAGTAPHATFDLLVPLAFESAKTTLEREVRHDRN